MEFEVSSPKPKRKHCADRSRASICCDCCSGCLFGACLAVVTVIFIVAAAAPSLSVQFAVTVQIGALLLFAITGMVACCCTGQPQKRRQPWQAALLLVPLLAIVLLSVRSTTQHRVLSIFFEAYALLVGNILGGTAPNPLPAGYCAAAASTGSSASDGSSWLASRAAQATSPAELANQVVAELTEEEKSWLVQGVGWTGYQQAPGFYMGNVIGVPRIGLPSMNMHDAGQGFRTTHRAMIGTVTSWPCTLAAAATFDASLVRRWATAIGREFRIKGANVLLGPGVDVARVLRNGRAAESLAGESPTLGSVLGGAYVLGLRETGVAAVAKHFSVYVQETNRALEGDGATPAYSTEVDERTLFEVYYAPVDAMIRAGLSSVMCSYSERHAHRTHARTHARTFHAIPAHLPVAPDRVNGTGACESSPLLTRDLRTRLGFSGWVLSDWWAVSTSGAAPAAAGLDQNMPGNDHIFDEIYLSAARANLSEMAGRIVSGMLSAGPPPLGAYASPACTVGCDCEETLLHANATSDEHAQLANEMAAAAAVLLKNAEVPRGSAYGGVTGRALPLPAGATVALIGSACNASHDIDAMMQHYAIGDYYVVGGSGRVLSPQPVSLLAALSSRGANFVLSLSDDISSGQAARSQADVAIACAGALATESSDRPTLALDQAALLEGLAAGSSTTPLVVLAYAPGPFLTSPWAAGAAAILTMFLSGQATGFAAADVLQGVVNPSGRLPMALPLSAADGVQVCTTAECEFDEGLDVGWRGQHTQPVAFPFGHGLSYTTFNYSWTQAPSVVAAGSGGSRSPSDGSNVAVSLQVEVGNTGSAAGREVVQVYLAFPESAGEPPLVLRAFERTALLASAETAVLSFALTSRDLSTWQPGFGWALARGSFEVVVGAHSRDQRLRATFAL